MESFREGSVCVPVLNSQLTGMLEWCSVQMRVGILQK
jgi:hypothetical protein